MEKNKKKKYYQYGNNRKYYPKKKVKKVLNEEMITYDNLVNAKSNINEIRVNNNPFKDDNSIIKFVAISTILLAIIFGSLLLFHLI